MCRLPGKAINVALALYWLAGMKKCRQNLRLTKSTYQLFNVSRRTTLAKLKEMEEAGLIKVDRGSGRKNSITILPVKMDSAKGSE